MKGKSSASNSFFVHFSYNAFKWFDKCLQLIVIVSVFRARTVYQTSTWFLPIGHFFHAQKSTLDVLATVHSVDSIVTLLAT